MRNDLRGLWLETRAGRRGSSTWRVQQIHSAGEPTSRRLELNTQDDSSKTRNAKSIAETWASEGRGKDHAGVMLRGLSTVDGRALSLDSSLVAGTVGD